MVQHIIDITIIQGNCSSFNTPHWTKVCFTMFTVEPPLTTTSQQWPLFLADSPVHTLTLVLKTSLQQPLSSFPRWPCMENFNCISKGETISLFSDKV